MSAQPSSPTLPDAAAQTTGITVSSPEAERIFSEEPVDRLVSAVGEQSPAVSLFDEDNCPGGYCWAHYRDKGILVPIYNPTDTELRAQIAAMTQDRIARKMRVDSCGGIPTLEQQRDAVRRVGLCRACWKGGWVIPPDPAKVPTAVSPATLALRRILAGENEVKIAIAGQNRAALQIYACQRAKRRGLAIKTRLVGDILIVTRRDAEARP